MKGTFKKFAQQAKQRMKSGFWQETRNRLEMEKQVAVTKGLDCVAVREQQHRQLERMIYDSEGYNRERLFQQKVEEILTSEHIVSNPISILADKDYMSTLNAYERQTYLIKLSAKYQEAVEKYRQLHG